MQRTTRHRALLLVGLFLLLSGCGLLSLDERTGDLRALIQRNRENWEEAGPQSYQFTYNKTIGGTQKNGVWVRVVQAQIDSVSVEGEGVENPEAFLTIDDLYDEIVQNFEREDRGTFRVQFDEEFSYPKRYHMEPGASSPGRGVVVTRFEPLES